MRGLRGCAWLLVAVILTAFTAGQWCRFQEANRRGALPPPAPAMSPLARSDGHHGDVPRPNQETRQT